MPESLQKSISQSAGDWSDVELTSAVQAYLGMLYAELDGVSYNKAEVSRQLREGPLAGRTKGSIEFRMQNISAALYELKMPRIAGYLPARNIGSSVKEKLIALLRLNGIDSLAAFVPTSDQNSLAQKVTSLRKRHLGRIPTGTSSPAVVTSTTTTFVRDPAVKAWVLQCAKGTCEGCDNPAPFIGQDGLPYLEVHHVMPLSSHGSDTITNAVALCPNCHRRCHFSSDRDELKLELYEKISRLILEVPGHADAETDEFIDLGYRSSSFGPGQEGLLPD
jgi:5-methylcytosine-specific restriction protein A